MKHRVMSAALTMSLALCPPTRFRRQSGQWGTSPAGMVAAATGGTTAEYTTGTSSSSSGPLAVVGKIGADIAQQQARG